jgi:hypothetical protein
MASAYMYSNGDGDVTGWVYTSMSNYNSTKTLFGFGGIKWQKRIFYLHQ